MNIDVTSNPVVAAPADVRAAFIRRTYLHLGGAILGFMAVEALLLSWSGARALVGLLTGGFAWLVVLGAFLGVSILAERWARSEASPQTQYLGLGLFVVAEAVIFLPLLYVAAYYSSPDVIPTAGVLTGLLFAGLTFAAFTSGVDFSFLRGVLTVGGFLALGLIVASILFGFTLGLVFSAVMVAYAAGAILYQTSTILREYRADQHVAAALALFASVALLFWYVLSVVLQLTTRD